MIGYLSAPLAGQVHSLRLTVAGYIDTDSNVDGGIAGLWDRLANETYQLAEVRRVLSVSLVGGGMRPSKSERLLTAHYGPSMARRVRDLCRALIAVCISAPDGSISEEKKGKSDPDFSSADIYQTAGAIGLKPADLSDMTMWQFNQYLEGWNTAQGGGADVAPPDQDELAELMQRYG
ncbi:GTA-gp10 family protein [Brucella pituitosa]|uniref:Gene transfer agent family protein n=1 Tax=Brucella pituitosa TaxID=571256 RepID=A0A643EXW1_9HYPH|nr:GTA-gp10 family protein [Brucella pituitosa]KAB0570578.1 gene transfer agent family protein [Brucella pituitosa]